MKRGKKTFIDIEIDKLTNSIENVLTRDNFPTNVSLLAKTDLKHITKKNGWLFNWKYELKQLDREVYKLTIVNNPSIIQGLISLTVKPDHVYLYLVESAPFNIGRNKVYAGVPGNLIAFACQLSFQRGGEGFVSFEAKTKLIEHYIKTLGASHVGGQLMTIENDAAQRLIDKYFNS